MNLQKLLRINNKTHIILNTCIRSNSIWNKDWKPGPYPRTPDEQKLAAEKYGIEVSIYKPYPDDGTGHGDYPKLPDVSNESKDPYYLWDFPEHKRNLHDIIHVEQDMYGEDRFYINQRLRIPFRTQLLTFLIVMGTLYGIYEFLDLMPLFRPVKPKQYPKSGEVHYTFELVDSTNETNSNKDTECKTNKII